jgi:hypothetical protein
VKSKYFKGAWRVLWYIGRLLAFRKKLAASIFLVKGSEYGGIVILVHFHSHLLNYMASYFRRWYI